MRALVCLSGMRMQHKQLDLDGADLMRARPTQKMDLAFL